MVFSDPVFIFLFLPLCLVAYLALGGKFRLFVVNVFGVVFYVWDGGSFVNLILIQTLLTFVFGILVDKSRGKRNASLALVSIGIALNLGSLVYFKYAGFGIEIVNSLASKFGLSEVGLVNHLLPLGISFFTFQFLSYLIDIYRGVSSPAPELRQFFAYIFLFPHLIDKQRTCFGEEAQTTRRI
jgi:alginate O-acetyltransferase complex protein AlgI